MSTLFTSACKETAIEFVDALHIWHSLDVANCHNTDCAHVLENDAKRHGRHSGWLVIQKHNSPGAALEFHLELTKDFINGGTDEEWAQGWKTYAELRHKFESETKED